MKFEDIRIGDYVEHTGNSGEYWNGARGHVVSLDPDQVVYGNKPVVRVEFDGNATHSDGTLLNACYRAPYNAVIYVHDLKLLKQANKFKVGDRVDGLSDNGNIIDVYINAVIKEVNCGPKQDYYDVYSSDDQCSGYFRESQLQLHVPIVSQQDIELETLRKFKTDAIEKYPDLNDDPDYKIAVELANEWLDSTMTGEELAMKALKRGRQLQAEGK